MTNFNGSNINDVFTGGPGADTAVGNGGADTLSGAGGNDLLVGNAGGDSLNGGDGEDTLYSGDETPPFSQPYYNNPYTPPLLDRGSEVDTLLGGDGSDRLFGGYGDNLDGGADGTTGDYLYISFMGAPAGVTADFGLASQTIGGGVITGIENISWVEGSNFDDDITIGTRSFGYSDFTAVFGMDGNDRLVAGYYTGVLDGGEGNDIVDGRSSQYLQNIYGGNGADTLYTSSNTFAAAYGGAGDDTIYSHGLTYGGSGNDHVILQVTYYSGEVFGEAGDDVIEGASSGNVISGGDGADTITGDAAIDRLYSNSSTAFDAGLEHDVLAGFGGNDTLAVGMGDDADGGSGSDTLMLSFAGATSGVTFNTNNIGDGGLYTVFGGTINSIENFISLRGSEFADNLTIATQAVELTVDAGGGDDVIQASGSSVVVRGDNGADRFVSGAAGDTFDGGAGVDTADFSGATGNLTVNLLTGTASANGVGTDTLLNVESVIAAAGNDTLTGDGANNRLEGAGGADTIDGGAGADTLIGGAGDEVYFVDDSGDVITELAGEGVDEVRSSSTYVLSADVEILTLTGTANIGGTGNSGSNAINGNTGDNLLDGAAGADTLTGGAGNDTYVVDNAGDLIVEAVGEGVDTVQTASAFSIAALLNVENITLTGGASVNATGNSNANTLIGNGAANSLDGGNGSDVLDGGAGLDTLIGGAGDDIYLVDSVTDVLTESANEGIDTVRASVTYSIAALASIENIALTGVATINATGNAGANILTGNSAANTLDGGAGADTLIGGAGNDTYLVDNAGDILTELGNEGVDLVQASVSYSIAALANLENITLVGAGAMNATGNAGANILTGNSAANTLDGGAGADTLIGGAGNDTYLVDNAGDILTELGNEGVDLVQASVSYSMAAFANLENITLVGAGAMNATGNAGANILTGNSAANTLDGGAGADLLNGGDGNDVLFFDQLDTLQGGAGTDYANASGSGAGVFVALQASELEGAWGSNFGDTLDSRGLQFGTYLIGNGGNDTLWTGAGADVVQGGDGNDVLYIDQIDTFDGGAGTDYANAAYATAGVNIVLQARGLEGVWASAYNDILDSRGLQFGTYLVGYGGADTIYTGAGADVIQGGDGDDFIFFDQIDSVDGGAGSDYGNAAYATAGVNVVMTARGLEGLWASAYNDVIDARGLTNGAYLVSYGGNDTIYSGGGADQIDGGAGGDVVIYGGAQSLYTITQTSPGVWTVARDGITDTITGVETLRFDSGDFILT